MPAYAYRCPACSATLDVLKKMEDANTVEWCPDCGPGQPMLRVYTAAATKVAGGTPRFHQRKLRRA